MDKVLLSKFNLYDQIGYLLVGGVGLILFYADVLLLKLTWRPDVSASNLIVWIIAAYFTGHILQSMANIFIKENKTEFSDSEKEILKQAQMYFGIKKQSWSETYLLCYMLSLAKDITGHVQSFNAYYSLYRGWFVAFFLESIFLATLTVVTWLDGYLLMYLLASVTSAFLFLMRANRFYKYSRAKTLQTFSLIRRLGL